MAIKMSIKPPSDQNSGQSPKTKQTNNLTFDKTREGVVEAQRTLYGRDQEGNINATVENKNPIRKSSLPILEGTNPAFKKPIGTQTTQTNTKSVNDLTKKRAVKFIDSPTQEKVGEEGKNNTTGHEANVNQDTARKEALQNSIEGANKVNYSFNIKPAFIKASSLYETFPVPIIDVRFLTVSGLPSFGQIGYRDDEIAFTNSIPPNLIKSFEFSLGGGEGGSKGLGTLEIEDTTFYEGEALMNRIAIAENQLKRAPGLRITFGWSEIDRNLPRSIRRRHFPNFTRDFIILKIEPTITKSSVNYKITLSSDFLITSPIETMLKPYGILGPKPLNRLSITKFIEKINRFIESNNLADPSGTISNEFTQKMIDGILSDYDLASLFGNDRVKIKDFVTTNGKLIAETFYSQYQNFKKISPELNNAFEKVNGAITKRFLDSSVNGGRDVEEKREQYSAWLDKLGKASNMVMAFSHMVDDEPVDALDALRFVVNSYIIQRTSLIKSLQNREQAKDIPGIVVMSLFSEKDIMNQGRLDSGSKKDDEIRKELENALKGIKSGSIDCSYSQSWEDLIRVICKNVRIGKGEKEKIPYDKVKSLQCKIFTVPLAQLEQVNGEYRVNENTTDDRTYLVFDALEKSLRDSVPLYQNDPQKATYTLELADRVKQGKKNLIKVYEEAKKNGLRYLTYIIISEDSTDAFFDNAKWGSPLLQKYDIRPKGQTLTSNRGYFNLGGDSILDQGLPDVIEFAPSSLELQSKITNFYKMAFSEVDKEIKVSKKVPEQLVTRLYASTSKPVRDKKEEKPEDKKLKDKADPDTNNSGKVKEVSQTERAMVEFERLAKIKYPIMLPAFNQPFLHTDPNELNINALELKKNLTNLRRRMMYGANLSGMGAELTILGEPYFQEYTVNRDILIDYTNPDGSKSFFTGIYKIASVKHKITQGSFTTTLTLNRVALDPNSSEFMDALIDDTLILNEE